MEITSLISSLKPHVHSSMLNQHARYLWYLILNHTLWWKHVQTGLNPRIQSRDTLSYAPEPPVGRCELWTTQIMRKKGQFVNGKIGWVRLSGRYEEIELAAHSEPGSVSWTVRLTLPNKSRTASMVKSIKSVSECLLQPVQIRAVMDRVCVHKT